MSDTISPRAVAASSPLRGIVLKLLSIAIFAVMTACVKAARDVAPAGEAVFFRSFIALVPVLGYAAWRGRVAEAVFTRNVRGHAWRGVIGASAMGLSFAALGLLPLPEVIAISFAAPILTVVLAIFLLGEVVRLYRWTAVVVGLIGVLVMVWPRLTLIGEGVESAAALGAMLMLASALLMALAQIHVRRVAPRFQERLRSFAGHPLVGEARGVGLMGGIELSPDRARAAPFANPGKVGPRLQAEMMDRGVIVRAMGDTVGICPPMIITEEQIDELFAPMEAALDATHAWAKAEGYLK